MAVKNRVPSNHASESLLQTLGALSFPFELVFFTLG